MSVSLESLMRQRALEAPKSAKLIQFVWFVVIGAAAALGFVLLSSALIGVETGVPTWLMSALCYALFIVPVYFAHRAKSFRSDAPHRRALPRYLIVQLSALALASLFSFVAYAMLAVPTPYASVLVVVLTSGVNFVVLRLWAFASAENAIPMGELPRQKDLR